MMKKRGLSHAPRPSARLFKPKPGRSQPPFILLEHIEHEQKPWAGRFTQPTDEFVEAFTASIDFDQRLYRYDIQGSMAHARMLAKQGIIAADEAANHRRRVWKAFWPTSKRAISNSRWRWKTST
jgi:hypothetical protein